MVATKRERYRIWLVKLGIPRIREYGNGGGNLY
jgi:hypothetical protein